MTRGGRVTLLGLAWSVVTLALLIAGAVPLGVWFASNAGVAALELVRTRRLPHPQLAAAAGLPVVAAAFGVIGAGLGVVAAVAVLLRGGRAMVISGLAVAAAVLGPVVLRATNGLVPALVLLVYAAVYDSASFVIGGDARFRWEGPLAGVACIGTVTIAVAAVFPQFKGASPWELGGLAAVLTPLGPMVATRLVGPHPARIPAVHRLDSLLLLGPVWSAAAAVLVS